jgi:hypothetical protein
LFAQVVYRIAKDFMSRDDLFIGQVRGGMQNGKQSNG